MHSHASLTGAARRIASFALVAALLATTSAFPAHAAENSGAAPNRPHLFRPIVDGMRVQARSDDLDRLKLADVTPTEARDIDELYRRLMGTAPRQPSTSSVASGDPQP
jgi:hypothetical protein